VAKSKLLFDWRDDPQDSLEQRIQKLADLHNNLGVEVAEIRALLHSDQKVEITPDQLAMLTIEERVSMLAKSQQDLARDVHDLKAVLSGHSDNIY
jgi:DNA-binding transcriptional MerR regulator